MFVSQQVTPVIILALFVISGSNAVLPVPKVVVTSQSSSSSNDNNHLLDQTQRHPFVNSQYHYSHSQPAFKSSFLPLSSYSNFYNQQKNQDRNGKDSFIPQSVQIHVDDGDTSPTSQMPKTKTRKSLVDNKTATVQDKTKSISRSDGVKTETTEKRGASARKISFSKQDLHGSINSNSVNSHISKIDPKVHSDALANELDLEYTTASGFKMDALNLTQHLEGNVGESFFTRLFGDKFLGKLDFAIWKHGLKNLTQFRILENLLGDTDSKTLPHENSDFLQSPETLQRPHSHPRRMANQKLSNILEEEPTKLTLDNVATDKSSEVRDLALKKWLNLSDNLADDQEETVEELSYKILSLVDKEDEQEDEEQDKEIYTAVLASMAAYQLRRLRKQLSHGRVKRSNEPVCYRDLGCFTDDGAFNYFDYLPDPPEEIGTKFLLYTRQNRDSEELFTITNSSSIKATHFSSSRETKVLVHGFGSSCGRLWVREMREALLTMVDVNLICVDWEKGATVPNYMRAASNTRLVGRQVSIMIKHLMTVTNATVDSFHLIGFSLGAHVSGHAGKHLKLKRISGLDPAGPLFENSPPSVRLDRSDAEYVDVIHTNAESLIWGGLGAYQPMGHVDFYPNGGRMQKGCDNLFVGGVTDILWPTEGDGRSLCNHRRGYKYFVESIAPVCKFPSFVCSSYETFLTGDCFPCVGCGNMGYYSDQAEGRGQLYLVTRDTEPFCANQYKVSLKHSGGPPLLSAVSTYGRVDVTFIGEGGINETIPLTRMPDEELQAGSSSTRILVPHPAITGVKSLQLLYTAYQGWVYSGSKRWAVDKISVMDSYGTQQSFCRLGVTLESGVPMVVQLTPGDCTPRYRPWIIKKPVKSDTAPQHQNGTENETFVEVDLSSTVVTNKDGPDNTATSHQTPPLRSPTSQSGNDDNEFVFLTDSHASDVGHHDNKKLLPQQPSTNNNTSSSSSAVAISFPLNSANDRQPPSAVFSIKLPSSSFHPQRPQVNLHTSLQSQNPLMNFYPQQIAHKFRFEDPSTINGYIQNQHNFSKNNNNSSSEVLILTSSNPQDYPPHSNLNSHFSISGVKEKNILHNRPNANANIRDGPAPNLYPEDSLNPFVEEDYTDLNEQQTVTEKPHEILDRVKITLENGTPDMDRVISTFDSFLPNENQGGTADMPSFSVNAEDYFNHVKTSRVTDKNSTHKHAYNFKTNTAADPEFSYILQNENGEQGLLVLGVPEGSSTSDYSENTFTGILNGDSFNFDNFDSTSEGIKIIPYNSLIDGEIPINEMAKALFGKVSDQNMFKGAEKAVDNAPTVKPSVNIEQSQPTDESSMFHVVPSTIRSSDKHTSSYNSYNDHTPHQQTHVHRYQQLPQMITNGNDHFAPVSPFVPPQVPSYHFPQQKHNLPQLLPYQFHMRPSADMSGTSSFIDSRGVVHEETYVPISRHVPSAQHISPIPHLPTLPATLTPPAPFIDNSGFTISHLSAPVSGNFRADFVRPDAANPVFNSNMPNTNSRSDVVLVKEDDKTVEEEKSSTSIFPKILTNLAEQFSFVSSIGGFSSSSTKDESTKSDHKKENDVDSDSNSQTDNANLQGGSQRARSKGQKLSGVTPESSKNKTLTTTTEAPSIFSWRYYFGGFSNDGSSNAENEDDVKSEIDRSSKSTIDSEKYHNKREGSDTKNEEPVSELNKDINLEYSQFTNPRSKLNDDRNHRKSQSNRQERKFTGDSTDSTQSSANLSKSFLSTSGPSGLLSKYFTLNRSQNAKRMRTPENRRPTTNAYKYLPRIFTSAAGFRRSSSKHQPHPSFGKDLPPNYPFHQLNPFTALPTSLMAPPPPSYFGEDILPQATDRRLSVIEISPKNQRPPSDFLSKSLVVDQAMHKLQNDKNVAQNNNGPKSESVKSPLTDDETQILKTETISVKKNSESNRSLGGRSISSKTAIESKRLTVNQEKIELTPSLGVHEKTPSIVKPLQISHDKPLQIIPDIPTPGNIKMEHQSQQSDLPVNMMSQPILNSFHQFRSQEPALTSRSVYPIPSGTIEHSMNEELPKFTDRSVGVFQPLKVPVSTQSFSEDDALILNTRNGTHDLNKQTTEKRRIFWDPNKPFRQQIPAPEGGEVRFGETHSDLVNTHDLLSMHHISRLPNPIHPTLSSYSFIEAPSPQRKPHFSNSTNTRNITNK